MVIGGENQIWKENYLSAGDVRVANNRGKVVRHFGARKYLFLTVLKERARSPGKSAQFFEAGGEVSSHRLLFGRAESESFGGSMNRGRLVKLIHD